VVAWDAITDTGYLARNGRVAGRLARRAGVTGSSSTVCLDMLEQLLLVQQTDSIVMNPNWSAMKQTLPILNSHLFRNVMHAVVDNEVMIGEDLPEILAGLPDGEKQSLVVNFLIDQLARILQMPDEKISHNSSIQDLGVDSLMAMELAGSIESKLGVQLPVMALADNATLDNLAHRIVNILNSATDGHAEPGNRVEQIVSSLAKIHAEDLPEEFLESISRDVTNEMNKTKRLIQ
jgi:acyl carrier protein